MDTRENRWKSKGSGALRSVSVALAVMVAAATAGLIGVAVPAAEPAAAEVASHDVVAFDRSPTSGGYRAITSTGTIYTLGDLPSLPSYTGALNRPIVSAVNTVSGRGLTAVAADGGVFTFGDAEFYGSMGGRPLNRPIVDIERTTSGRGYWLVAADGGVFSFGDAAFYGAMGGRPLNQPVVAMAATPTGRGYILVAADGGVFTFGDAAFHGSMGEQSLNRPVVDVAMGPNGGYVMLAADGGVFTFDYPFHGSAVANMVAGNSAVRISRAFDSDGYSIATANGMIYNFATSAHGNTDTPPLPGGASMISPLNGTARVAGIVGDPRDGGRRQHLGIDLEAPAGTATVAVCRVTVTNVFYEPGLAWTVGGWVGTTQPGYRYWVAYRHLNRPSVSPGQVLSRGATVGTVFALQSGPHLHFEFKKENPRRFDGPMAVANQYELNAEFRRGRSLPAGQVWGVNRFAPAPVC